MHYHSEIAVFRQLFKKRQWHVLATWTEYALFIKANAEIINAILVEGGALFWIASEVRSFKGLECKLCCYVFHQKIPYAQTKALCFRIEVVEVTPELSLVCVEGEAFSLASRIFYDRMVEQFLLDLRFRAEEIENLE